jgi:hypothetical protein
MTDEALCDEPLSHVAELIKGRACPVNHAPSTRITLPERIRE